jgi:hypothetical protein
LDLAGLDEKAGRRRGKIIVSQAVHFSKQTEPDIGSVVCSFGKADIHEPEYEFWKIISYLSVKKKS